MIYNRTDNSRDNIKSVKEQYYGGIIKQTGWIIIAYYIVSLVWGVIEDEISNIIAFIFSFALDYFYYIYMRNLLSKN